MPSPGQRISAHTKARKARERQLRRAAQRILLAESDWYGPAQVRELANALGELVDNAVVQESRLTQAFLQGLYEDAGISPNTPRTGILHSQRMGVTTGEAYARVPAVYRTHIAAGESHEEALERSMDRLTTMLSTDLQLAHREATRRSAIVNPRSITGYRRIIRPEMSGGNVCGLCIAAADRVYTISELMPLHSGCNCDTSPRTRDFDPGYTLNREDLDALYAAAGGDETGADALRQVKLRVYNHGEVGPVMAPEGERRLTERRARTRAKPQNRSYEARPDFDALIASSDRTIGRLEEEIRLGTGDASTRAALEWQYGHRSSLLRRKETE